MPVAWRAIVLVDVDAVRRAGSPFVRIRTKRRMRCQKKPEASPQPWWDADFLARIENQASWAYAEAGYRLEPGAHMEGQPTCHEPRVCMSCSFLVADGGEAMTSVAPPAQAEQGYYLSRLVAASRREDDVAEGRNGRTCPFHGRPATAPDRNATNAGRRRP